jgi:hypothetical protein
LALDEIREHLRLPELRDPAAREDCERMGDIARDRMEQWLANGNLETKH